MQKKNRIQITNTKKIFDNSVAATALGFIFCLSRGIHYSLIFKNKKDYGRNLYDKIYYKMNDVFKKKYFLLDMEIKLLKFAGQWIWKYLSLKGQSKKNLEILIALRT